MSNSTSQKRSPIVVVMGHVDHGKTTLLDYIRKTAVAAKEAGGITQSIGAYEIVYNNQRITFIDTPGHEAFSKMRARGAHIADVAIIVIAADDSVKPQTKEAIKIAQETQTPFIVAVNKIDKGGADQERVISDLMQESVFLEGHGGNISWQSISAKTGQGVNELLDLVLLATELEDLTYDPAAPAEGFILESKLDSKRGIIVTAIVKNGTLKTGDGIAAGQAGGKIRSLENFLGQKIKTAIPASPVLITGFDDLPSIGEQFMAGPAVEKKAALKKETKPASKKENAEKNPTVKVYLKADVSGSLEALSQIIKNVPLPPNYNLEIVDELVGEITDGDVKTAIATGAVIIGFKVKANKAAENLAAAQKIRIVQSDIIYDLVKALEAFVKELGQEIIRGDLEILAVFGKKGVQQIVGGRVVKGEILNNAAVDIKRHEKSLGSGRIINAQREKKDVQRIPEGSEGGLLIDSPVAIKVGDHLLLK